MRPEQLAEVVPGSTVLPLLPEVAAATGLDAATPVVVGAADGPLANLGVGVLAGPTVACSLGTSGALRAVRATPLVDPQERLFCYALTEDRWVVGGAVNNAGSVLRWAVDALAGPGRAAGVVAEELLEEASRVPAGSDGLLCLPYLLGERAPLWRSDLTGAYLGLRRDHGRGHLVRAALEGVAQQLALVREALPAVGVEVTQVRATGGAVASSLWVQVLADALDLPVHRGPTTEGSAVGACLLGWSAVTGLDLDAAAAAVPSSSQVPPDPAAASLLRARRPVVERAALVVAELLAASAAGPPYG